jgi:hypothetical protein
MSDTQEKKRYEACMVQAILHGFDNFNVLLATPEGHRYSKFETFGEAKMRLRDYFDRGMLNANNQDFDSYFEAVYGAYVEQYQRDCYIISCDIDGANYITGVTAEGIVGIKAYVKVIFFLFFFRALLCFQVST